MNENLKSFCMDCNKAVPVGFVVCKDCWEKDKTPIPDREKRKIWGLLERIATALENINNKMGENV